MLVTLVLFLEKKHLDSALKFLALLVIMTNTVKDGERISPFPP